MSDDRAGEDGLMDLVVGTFSPSVLLAVAERTGALAGRGLRVREVAVTSSPAAFTALEAREVDLLFTSPDNVVAYRFDRTNPLGRKLDVQIVAALDRGLRLGAYGRPGAGEPVPGVRIGVDVPTSGYALALFTLLDSWGLSRDDLEVVALGSTPKRLAALADGACDVTLLNAGSDLRAEDLGMPLLGQVTEVASPYLGSVVAVINPHEERAVASLVTSLAESADAILDGDLSDEVAAAAEELLRLAPDTARRYVDALRDPDHGLVRGLVPDRESLTTITALRRRHHPVVDDGVDVLADAVDDDSGLVRWDHLHGPR